MNSQAHVLFVQHRPVNGPGGVEEHTRTLIEAWRGRRTLSVLYPEGGYLWAHVFGGEEKKFSVPYTSLQSLDALLAILRPDVAHVQHLQNHLPGFLPRLFAWPFARRIFHVHDYLSICANLNLQYRDRHYCAVPENLETCARCLRYTQPWSVSDLTQWREMMAHQLPRCNAVLVPDESVVEVLRRCYDVGAWKLLTVANGNREDSAAFLPAAQNKGPFRVAFVGAPARIKGYDFFLRLARVLHQRMEFHHFGRLNDAVKESGVRYHSTFAPGSLPGLLRDQGIDVVVMPSQTPETYSYTLSEVLQARIAVVASPLGAIARRIREADAGWIVDSGEPADFCALLDYLRTRPQEWRDKCANTARAPIFSAAAIADRLLEIYEFNGMNETSKPAADSDLLSSLAADNARLNEELAASRKEAEQLRRRVGLGATMELYPGDIQSTAAYKMAKRIQGAYNHIPVRVREPLKAALKKLL